MMWISVKKELPTMPYAWVLLKAKKKIGMIHMEGILDSKLFVRLWEQEKEMESIPIQECMPHKEKTFMKLGDVTHWMYVHDLVKPNKEISQ